MGKVIVFGVGYVLGARAGHERYEQIRRAYAWCMSRPAVRDRIVMAEDRLLNRYNT